MKELVKLRAMGYVFTLVEEKIHYEYQRKEAPPKNAKSLLISVREKRDEVIKELNARNHHSIPEFNQQVSIEDIPDYLSEHNLRVIGFDWQRGGDPTLFVESISVRNEYDPLPD